MSSFQGVGIEEFHCIQRCPYFKRGSPFMVVMVPLMGNSAYMFLFEFGVCESE